MSLIAYSVGIVFKWVLALIFGLQNIPPKPKRHFHVVSHVQTKAFSVSQGGKLSYKT